MVATSLRGGGIFNYYLYCKFISETVNQSNSEKSFKIDIWKSVKIEQSYCHKFGGPVFFGTQCKYQNASYLHRVW